MRRTDTEGQRKACFHVYNLQNATKSFDDLLMLRYLDGTDPRCSACNVAVNLAAEMLPYKPEEPQ